MMIQTIGEMIHSDVHWCMNVPTVYWTVYARMALPTQVGYSRTVLVGDSYESW